MRIISRNELLFGAGELCPCLCLCISCKNKRCYFSAKAPDQFLSEIIDFQKKMLILQCIFFISNNKYVNCEYLR